MLKDKRNEKGLTQQELSNVTGISIKTITHYEQGLRNINGAKLDTLITFAETLDCKISDIVNDPNLVNKCKKFGI